MPRINHNTFLFDHMGYEGTIRTTPSNDRVLRGALLHVAIDSSGHMGPVTQENMNEAFSSEWSIFLTAEELIELGRHLQQIGILSREDGPDESDN